MNTEKIINKLQEEIEKNREKILKLENKCVKISEVIESVKSLDLEDNDPINSVQTIKPIIIKLKKKQVPWYSKEKEKKVSKEKKKKETPKKVSDAKKYPSCPRCGSEDTRSAGFRITNKGKSQVIFCKDCKRKFTADNLERTCEVCGIKLTGQQRRFCNDKCSNHFYNKEKKTIIHYDNDGKVSCGQRNPQNLSTNWNEVNCYHCKRVKDKLKREKAEILIEVKKEKELKKAEDANLGTKHAFGIHPVAGLTIKENYDVLTDQELREEIHEKHGVYYADYNILEYRKARGWLRDDELNETEGSMADVL